MKEIDMNKQEYIRLLKNEMDFLENINYSNTIYDQTQKKNRDSRVSEIKKELIKLG